MKKLACLIACIACCGLSTHAQSIVFTITGTLDLAGGADAWGLDGATFTFETTYDVTDTYTQLVGGNDYTYYIPASSPTVTFSGTTGGTYDGVFTVEPVVYLPYYGFGDATSGVAQLPLDATGTGSLTGESFTFGLKRFNRPASPIVTSEKNPELTDFNYSDSFAFGTTLNDNSTEFATIGGSGYSLTSVSVTATAIPEASHFALALGLTGLAYVGFRRRRGDRKVA